MRVLLCVLLPALLAVATADYAWDVYSDANAVYGSIDSSLVTTHPNFLGKFQSPELCAAACLNKFGCLGFTFHQPDFEKPLWATTCYMLSGYQFIVNRMVPESKVQSWIRKERKTESGFLFDKYQDMSGSYAGDQYTAAQLAENPNGEKFYGTFESGAACARACAKDRSCAGVTWFGPQDPSLHKSCVAIASSSWIPTHQQGGSELWVKSSATPAEASKPHHHRQRPAVPPPEDKWGSYRRYRLKQQLEEDRKDHQAAETELRFASTWATQECDVTREEWKLRVDRAEDSLSAWKEVLESRKHMLHHHQSHVAGYHDHSKYINEGPASRIAFMKSCRHGDCAAKWCTAHPDECDDWHEALEDWKISHNDWQQYNHDHVVTRRQKMVDEAEKEVKEAAAALDATKKDRARAETECRTLVKNTNKPFHEHTTHTKKREEDTVTALDNVLKQRAEREKKYNVYHFAVCNKLPGPHHAWTCFEGRKHDRSKWLFHDCAPHRHPNRFRCHK